MRGEHGLKVWAVRRGNGRELELSLDVHMRVAREIGCQTVEYAAIVMEEVVSPDLYKPRAWR